MRVTAKFITPVRPRPDTDTPPTDYTVVGDVFLLGRRSSGRWARLSTNGLMTQTHGGWARLRQNGVDNFRVVSE